MGNKHVNGQDPYVMSPSEAAREAKSWVEHGGGVRHDTPHPHNECEHYHLYDQKQSEDLLILVGPAKENTEPDPNLEENDVDNSEDDSDDDDAGDDDNY